MPGVPARLERTPERSGSVNVHHSACFGTAPGVTLARTQEAQAPQNPAPVKNRFAGRSIAVSRGASSCAAGRGIALWILALCASAGKGMRPHVAKISLRLNQPPFLIT